MLTLHLEQEAVPSESSCQRTSCALLSAVCTADMLCCWILASPSLSTVLDSVGC
jgi:hypothetical protein